MWPGNRRGAVSITYDDGHPSNLDLAIPDLERFGLCGTFFLTPGIYDVADRADDWRKVLLDGHEIANHTWNHPCGEQLARYDVNRYAREQTGLTEQWLNEHICRDGERTFAYTCGETELGINPGAQARYLDLVQATFLGARTGQPGPVSPSTVNAQPYLIPANAVTYGVDEAQPAIEYCRNAAEIGGWAVLIFHYIVEGKPEKETETSRQVHLEILSYLANNQAEYWIAPFRKVLKYILERR